MLALISFVELFRLVTLMGFAQGIILTVLLWRRRREERGIILVVFHLAALSAIMLLPLVEEGFGVQNAWPLHAVVFFLFQGLYLYVRHFQQPITPRQQWLHWVLPAVVLFPASYLTYHDFPQESAAELENTLAVTLLSCAKIGVNLVYAVATLWLLRRHRQMLLHVYSETTPVNLQWVSRLIYGFFGILLGGALFYGIARTTGWSMQMADLFTYIGFVLYLYYAYLHTTQQRPILSLATNAPAMPPAQEKEKYQRSSLTPEQAAAIFVKIQAVMESEKLYRDADLTLPILSEAIGAPTYYISQVLNELAGANFYDFINAYRVEEAKRLLTDPAKRHYTVLAVAFEAGFNSKTTFNKVFKNVTGRTPTEYLMERRGEDEST